MRLKSYIVLVPQANGDSSVYSGFVQHYSDKQSLSRHKLLYIRKFSSLKAGTIVKHPNHSRCAHTRIIVGGCSAPPETTAHSAHSSQLFAMKMQFQFAAGKPPAASTRVRDA
ncbi:hypothetical protein EVAR_84529_1 [Eumeta japonica]|uniref:Uncharacterized protein n=1 Tax=Eumeta variegata TaxID=151549 RepID=A0A4C1UII7_EUMVA|nr:hypothetical protein EVAR_84529_1 [Eumeta japonica]